MGSHVHSIYLGTSINSNCSGRALGALLQIVTICVNRVMFFRGCRGAFLGLFFFLFLAGELYPEGFFERWEIHNRIADEYSTYLDLWHPELSIRAQGIVPEQLKAGIEYRPQELPLIVMAGHLSRRSLLDLLYNPLSSERFSGQGSFAGLPLRSAQHVPTLLVMLPFLHISLSSEEGFQSAGMALNIGQPHNFLRIIGHFAPWKGTGSDDLVHPFWMPGVRNVLNGAVIVDIPPARYEDDSGIGLLRLSDSFVLMAGLQVPLPVMSLSAEPYMLHSVLWWFRARYHISGSILLPEEQKLTWKLEGQAAYLSDSYMRSDAKKSSILEAGQLLKLRGEVGISGTGTIYASLHDRGDERTTILFGVNINSSVLKATAELDYRPQSQIFYSRFSAALRGQVQPGFKLSLLWHELKARFKDAEIGCTVQLDGVAFGGALWCKHTRASDLLSDLLTDFLPSPFDTLVGLKLNLNVEIQIPGHQLETAFTLASPASFSLDRIIYSREDESAPFLHGWELQILFTIRNDSPILPPL